MTNETSFNILARFQALNHVQEIRPYVREEIEFIFQRKKDCYFFNDLLAKKELPLRVTTMIPS